MNPVRGSLLLVIIILLSIPILGQVYDPRVEEARLHFKKAFRSFNEARFPEAVRWYKESLDLDPSFPTAWYWAGKAYYKLGLMDQTILCWKRFLGLAGEQGGIARKIKNIFSQEYKRQDRPIVYKYLKTIVGARWDKGRFSTPTSLVIDNRENIYLVSAANPGILRFSGTGEYLGEFGKRELSRPYGIALDREGNIYVTDLKGDCIKKFNPKGKAVLTIGRRGKDDGQLLGPQGITVDSYGNIYVVDSGNTRVVKFDPEGKFLMKFGQVGNYAGCFTHPTDIHLVGDDRIWVSDSAGSRIQEFDSSGNFLAEFRPPTDLAELRGMVDDGESFFIADAKGRIFNFRRDSNQWQSLNLEGRELGIPVDVAVDQNGVLYVADLKGQAIEIFAPPEFIGTRFDVTLDQVITDHYPTIVYAVSVTGKGRHPIPHLTSKNFKVLEKGREIYPIAVRVPLQEKENMAAIFVVDTSKDMEPYKDDIKRVIFKFVEEMKGEGKALAVVSFNERVYIPQSTTLNKDQITYSVGLLGYDKRFRSDALAKAVYEGVSQTLNLFGKRCVILFTKGRRGAPRSSLMEEVCHYARNNYVQVMIIDCNEGEEVDDGLNRFAASTNGLYLLAHRSPSQLNSLYKEILHLTRYQTQYLIYYETPGGEFSGRWIDGAVAAGYGQLYGEDLGGYFVP